MYLIIYGIVIDNVQHREGMNSGHLHNTGG